MRQIWTGLPLGVLCMALVVVASPASPAWAKFEPAKRTHAPELKPPANQAGAGIEGWALVCVTVKADGTTANPRVIDVSPNDEFAEAGKRASEGWKFRPAKLDGEAVDVGGVCGIQLFTVGSPISEKTDQRLDEAQAFLKEDEYDDAARTLKGLDEEGPLTLKQGARLQLMQYQVAAEAKDEAAAVAAVQRASIGDGRFLPEDDAVNALGAKFHGWVNQRRYSEALELFDTFEALPGGAKPMVQHGATAKELRELGQSDKSYTVPVKLAPGLAGGRPFFRHRPFRREIGARKLDGKLDGIVFDCDLRTMRLDYQEDVSWTIPPSWGECVLYAEGDEGTTLELIEYAPTAKE